MSTRQSFLSTRGLIRPSLPFKRKSFLISPHSSPGGTTPANKTSARTRAVFNAARSRLASIAATNTLALCALLSFLFIGSLSFAFLGAAEPANFKDLLDHTARSEPGLLLLGDYVDIDIDEPSITVRWSLVACGEAYMLAGSGGNHNSADCGVPDFPVDVYVEGTEDPAMRYRPVDIPFLSSTASRRNGEGLTQFDSDHELDVHHAPLYPFDQYVLISNIYAWDPTTNESLPLRLLKTIDMTSSFDVVSTDVETYITPPGGGQIPCREVSLRIRRPTEARAFVILLWIIGWIFTHMAIGQVVLFLSSAENMTLMDPHFLTAIGVLFVLPQLRNAMPDAPGLDGVLIDNIGFFPQIVVSGLSVVLLLVTAAKRELQTDSGQYSSAAEKPELKAHFVFPSPAARLSAARRRSSDSRRAPELPPLRAPLPRAHRKSPLSVEVDRRFVIADDQTSVQSVDQTRSTESMDTQFSDIMLS